MWKNESYLTVAGPSAMLKVTRGCIHRWIYQGKLEYLKLGNKRVRFRLSDVKKWLKKHEVTVDEKTTAVPCLHRNGVEATRFE